MSMSTWMARSRADELQELVDEHAARIFGDKPARGPSGQFVELTIDQPNGGEPYEQCSGCPRVRPVWELIIAPPTDKIAPGAYCGACRERMRMRGEFTPADWAEAAGAPPEVVMEFRAREGS